MLYCEIHSISIKRNLEKFPYEFEGKTYMYLPDFIVEDEFVEIKGYMTERNKAKLAYFPYVIQVYDKNNGG